MFWRITLFGTTIIAAATGPLWLFAAAALAYIVCFAGVEILLVGFLVDAYFGYGHMTIPWYTVSLCIALFLLRSVRPYISMYNQ
jgi:hypothetical protein